MQERQNFNRTGGYSPGFSLIELLIIFVLIGIISSIAFFNYKRYILISKRVEAVTNLGEIRHLEETYRAENNVYLLCNWSPRDVPPPDGSDDWNQESFFNLLGFKPRGLLRYRYGVAGEGNLTTPQCLNDVNSCYNRYVVKNRVIPFHDGIVDFLVKAEGDLDGDGRISKLFVVDEPKLEVHYLDYTTF